MGSNYVKREAINILQEQVAALQAQLTSAYVKIADATNGKTYKVIVNNGVVITEEV